MSSRSLLPLLLFLFSALLTAKPPATPPELVDFDWRGEDVVLVFSDSVTWQVELAESDTSQVVVRLRNVAIAESVRQSAAGAEAPQGSVAISLGGREGRTATLTQRGRTEASVRVHSDGRLGYSIEWRPYTRQLVVHTFDWDRLSYGESQFHEGLIALEQGVTDQAEELLRVAGASREDRANGVLASLYARRGEDSLAQFFLRDPSTAEDFAALAAIQQRAGDSAAADESRARSQRLLEQGERRVPRSDRQGRDGAPTGDYGDGEPGVRSNDVVMLAIVGGLALLLIIGLIVLSTRRSRPRNTVTAAAPPAPIVPRRESTGFRVVDPTTPVVTAEPAPVDAPPTVASPEDARRTDVALAAGSSPRSNAPEPPRTTWGTAADRRAMAAQQEPATPPEPPAPSTAPMRSELAGNPGESTVDAARRLQVSRDNVELRRRMQEAAGREKNVPD
jgi:hypothetical protein